MKTLENKKVEKIIDVKDYGELMILCLNATPQGGFTPSEMRERIRVINAIKDVKDDKIELEDNDFNKLYACAKQMKWPAISSEIIELHDYLDGIQK